MNLPTGQYNRSAIAPWSRKFCPTQSVDALAAVSLPELWQSGKRLILLDADNTLLPWQSEEMPATSRAWIDQAKALGFQVILVSNTRNRARLEYLAGTLGIRAAAGKFKPSRSMFEWSMREANATPGQTVMIGDQIFTDILGANRAQVDSILVQQLAEHEFIGTKVNRLLEKVIKRRLVHAMQSEDDDFEMVPKRGIFQSRIARQFAKFCVVGGLSFAIDYNIRLTLQFAMPGPNGLLSESVGQWLMQSGIGPVYAQNASTAFFPIAAFAGGLIALLNSFFWNRRWTFRIKDPAERAVQFRKFVMISVTGILLNTLISSAVFNLLHAQDEKAGARVATVVATAIVAFWNFFGQRLYAFKKNES